MSCFQNTIPGPRVLPGLLSFRILPHMGKTGFSCSFDPLIFLLTPFFAKTSFCTTKFHSAFKTVLVFPLLWFTSTHQRISRLPRWELVVDPSHQSLFCSSFRVKWALYITTIISASWFFQLSFRVVVSVTSPPSKTHFSSLKWIEFLFPFSVYTSEVSVLWTVASFISPFFPWVACSFSCSIPLPPLFSQHIFLFLDLTGSSFQRINHRSFPKPLVSFTCRFLCPNPCPVLSFLQKTGHPTHGCFFPLSAKTIHKVYHDIHPPFFIRIRAFFFVS